MIMAIIFNVLVPYCCLGLMLVSWFTTRARGWLVTAACLLVKWCHFHQYSATLNNISLAFEIVIPGVLPDGLWLENVVGIGGLTTITAIMFAIVLAEVLLWTYAHSPARNADTEAQSKMPWARASVCSAAFALAKIF